MEPMFSDDEDYSDLPGMETDDSDSDSGDDEVTDAFFLRAAHTLNGRIAVNEEILRTVAVIHGLCTIGTVDGEDVYVRVVKAFRHRQRFVLVLAEGLPPAEPVEILVCDCRYDPRFVPTGGDQSILQYLRVEREYLVDDPRNFLLITFKYHV